MFHDEASDEIKQGRFGKDNIGLSGKVLEHSG